MPRTTAIYIRPSPGHPVSAEAQEIALRNFAEDQGLRIAAIYREASLTQRARRDGLAARDRLISTSGRQFGTVIISSACRLGRDLSDLVAAIAALQKKGVAVIVAGPKMAGTGSIDWLTMNAARQSYRSEAAAEGRQRARAQGVRFGRPPIPADRLAQVRDLLAAGHGVRPAARIAGVSPATAMRVKTGALVPPS
ncbi:recombinase family protein [Roseomonas harenae]|uniref:recombinase family protein n=1 Tax=Muricoccus harenae TaxID=2692566 RepID=UPI0013319523|nr:recombinase family protein [Roseomonas harenae]